jgi:ribosomal-protein-alanine N-acetyltransferase
MKSEPIITTDRLILRHWHDADIEPFIQINSDATVMKYFPSVMSAEQSLQFVRRIQTNFEEYGYGLYAVESKSTSEFIGFIGFSHPHFDSFFTPCIEIGWRLSSKYWGLGYATEGATACLKHGFSVLNFDKIYSFTASVNLPSVNVMKKIGLKFLGEFDHPILEIGSWLSNHLLYGISFSEWRIWASVWNILLTAINSFCSAE